MITTGKMISSFNKLSQLIFSRKCIEISLEKSPGRRQVNIKNNLKFKHARVIGKLYSYLYYTFTCVNFVSLKRNAVVSPESRFARRRSPGYWSIRPMTYNTLQNDKVKIHLEVLFQLPLDSTSAVTVFPCIFPFFRLKERQIRFGRNDLIPLKQLSL